MATIEARIPRMNSASTDGNSDMADVIYPMHAIIAVLYRLAHRTLIVFCLPFRSWTEATCGAQCGAR